jgi:thiol-disulfide isomerase/thioredoxin
LYGDYWLNSEPVPITALHGRVVLLHFWDFTSSSCIRTIPYLKEWSRIYESFGLSVIGVHRPRYKFGQNPETVFRSIERLGISYPVVLDNQHLLSAQYDIRSIPSLLLIDTSGFVRYQCTGEGGYELTEQLIQRHLYETGVREMLPIPMQVLRDEDRQGSVCFRATPELLAGYLEGNVGNHEGVSPESAIDYEDPGLYVEGKIYLSGRWMNGRDFFCMSEGKEGGEVCFEYRASEVFAVMSPGSGGPIEVGLSQDGEPLSEENEGADVLSAAGQRTFVDVDEPRSYALVKNPGFGEHTLRLSVSTAGFSLYAISFSTSVIPEAVSES